MGDTWCRWLSVLLILVIILFALVETAASKWLIFAAAILLLLHSLFCNCYSSCKKPEKAKPKAKKK